MLLVSGWVWLDKAWIEEPRSEACSFEDDYAITIPDDESDPSEQRFVSIGDGLGGKIVVVVYTWRGETIRVISARLAEAHERYEYEEPR